MKQQTINKRNSRLKIAKSAGLILFVACVLAGCIGLAVKVHALSSDGPDSSDFATNSALYTVSNTKDVSGASTLSLAIHHSGSKPTSDTTFYVYMQGGTAQGSTQQKQGEGSVHFNVNGDAWRAYHNAGDGTLTYTVTPSDWSPQGTNGWTTVVNAELKDKSKSDDDSNHVNFHVHIGGSGNVIGPNGGDYFGVLQKDYCSGGGSGCAHYRYSIPFAPSCNIESGDHTVTIHDMDDGNNLIQPKHLKVQIINVTTGKTVNNDDWTGSEGNGGDAVFKFYAVGGDKYRLVLDPAYTNNVLQIRIPYDSPAYEQSCAPPAHWSLSATTTPKSSRVTAGDKVTFDSTLKASGNDTATDFCYGPRYFYTDDNTPSRGGSGAYSGELGSNTNPSGKCDGSLAAGDTYGPNSRTDETVTVDPPGGNPKYICGTFAFSPTNSDGDTNGRSAAKCVPIDYPASVAVCKTNSDPPAPSVNQTVKILATVTLTHQTDVTPDGTFTINGARATTTSKTGSLSSGNWTLSASAPYVVPSLGEHDLPVAFAASPGTPAVTCPPVAVVAASHPYVKVYGGDVEAGYGPATNDSCSATADITSWNNENSPTYSGAGTQFGAQAMGIIEDFVSAQNNGSGSPGRPSAGSGLSFANAGSLTGGQFGGNFGDSQACTDYARGLALKTPPAGNLTVPKGTHDVYYVKDQDVYISGTVMYDESGYSLGAVPSYKLVVVGGNIYIDSTVAELDGLYVAEPDSTGNGGTIYTCASNASGTGRAVSTSDAGYFNTCGTQLKVYGSFIAKKIDFLRTGGVSGDVTKAATDSANGSSGSSSAAEEFIYSPEEWLGQPSVGVEGAPDAITSLPPVQ